MSDHIGVVEAIFRYPVKSMAAEPLTSADVGFHGLTGDRRFALRRLNSTSNRPWLSASRCPDLIRYVPDPSVTFVRTPEGRELAILSDELASDVTRRCGEPVQMMQLIHGVFDDADISIISTATIAALADSACLPLDPRRFRPNLLVRLTHPAPFQEDAWLASLLTIGEVQIACTQHDIRCSMINLDPQTAASSPAVQKAALSLNANRAGACGSILHPGIVTVGLPLFRSPLTPHP